VLQNISLKSVRAIPLTLSDNCQLSIINYQLFIMGQIKQGILGPVSGTVGPVVGGIWKGISYLRSKAASHADAQTDAQLTQRQKFAVISRFIQPLSEFLQMSFKAYAMGQTGINAAFSYNIKNALTGTYPNIAIDYPNALVAKGNLAGLLNQVAASTVAGTVHFTWEDNSGEVGASAYDKTLLVVYNPAQHQAVTVNQLAERADGTQTITVPDSFSGDLVQCYIAFVTVNGQVVSNSAFAGAVTVA
jgi:hypothetical protein